MHPGDKSLLRVRSAHEMSPLKMPTFSTLVCGDEEAMIYTGNTSASYAHSTHYASKHTVACYSYHRVLFFFSVCAVSIGERVLSALFVNYLLARERDRAALPSAPAGGTSSSPRSPDSTDSDDDRAKKDKKKEKKGKRVICLRMCACVCVCVSRV